MNWGNLEWVFDRKNSVLRHTVFNGAKQLLIKKLMASLCFLTSCIVIRNNKISLTTEFLRKNLRIEVKKIHPYGLFLIYTDLYKKC